MIANTDMHAGNLAFWLEDDAEFRLAPAYDMLPMLWAPTAQGEIVERDFSPDAGRMREFPEMWDLAAEFWRRLRDDDAVSSWMGSRASRALKA